MKPIVKSIKIKRVRDDLTSADDKYGADPHPEARKHLAAFQRGEWYFVGVVAEAEIHVPLRQGSIIIQQLKSGGIWGIDSDNEGAIRMEARETFAELEDILDAFDMKHPFTFEQVWGA